MLYGTENILQIDLNYRLHEYEYFPIFCSV